MECSVCKDTNIYNIKKLLCRKCYGAYYRKILYNRKKGLEDGKSQIMHGREEEFVKNHFNHINWIYSPASFRLKNTIRYIPDFYDAEMNVFIEVVGSRQAYHQNKGAYAQFRELYPKINFEIRKFTGEIVDENNVRMNWPVEILDAEEEPKIKLNKKQKVDRNSHVATMTLNTRKALKETQEKFGKRFKVKGAAISKWETGRALPDYFIIMKIQKLYLKTQKLSANVGG